MNTPAHMALSLAVLGRRSRRGEWWAILIGAVLPDLFLFAGHGLRGRGSGLEAANAVLVDIFNSLPLYALVLAVAAGTRWRWGVLLAASALLHIALDLPLHNHDARAHFFPFTDRVFVSPVSFWDASHYGRVVGLLEGVLFAACLVAIWRRLETPVQRLAAAAFAAVYLAAFVHFVGHAFASAHWAIW